VIITDNYVVKGGKQQWLARMHDDGTSEDISHISEHEIKQLAVSADGTSLATGSQSFYQEKIQHGLPEV
jgi:hypothetical protein